jgi:hypothetical protein
MREILFRAIRKGKFNDGVHWIYGIPYTDANGKVFMILNEDLSVPFANGYPTQILASSRFKETLNLSTAALITR